MMAKSAVQLLEAPSEDEIHTAERASSSYNPLTTFVLPRGEDKKYTQQFADLYFLRLAILKPDVEKVAAEAWKNFELAGQKPAQVERVLDVRQGQLCWMVGTVFMQLPLKPNVLDDISKEHWIIAPPERKKYRAREGGNQIYLEDESGRLALTGHHLKQHLLVTGCIVATMGTENASGEFEVVDIKVADLPRQPERWERDESAIALSNGKVKQKRARSGKVAIVSGLEIKGDGSDTFLLDLLAEYLLGESTSDDKTAKISRLIIAGNALHRSAPIASREEYEDRPLAKRFGHEPLPYDPVPSEALDIFLAQLLPSIPITILPGDMDPSSVAVPQQPMHPAIFPNSRPYAKILTDNTGEPSWFDNVTNPWDGDIDGLRFLGNGGQPINDMYKYVREGDNRLRMMEHLLRWRNNAPTAPDTLWTFPFVDNDPFILRECPHVFFVGNQPRFSTKVIEGPTGQQVTLISVPKFKKTGKLVLLDTETLKVECVTFKFHRNLRSNGSEAKVGETRKSRTAQKVQKGQRVRKAKTKGAKGTSLLKSVLQSRQANAGDEPNPLDVAMAE